MAAFAFYRLPYKDSYTLVMQNDDDPEKLSSVDELNGKSGFVIAPFMPSEECPILLMRPDVVKHIKLKAEMTIQEAEVSLSSKRRNKHTPKTSRLSMSNSKKASSTRLSWRDARR